jgi:hypothetical protein
MEEIEDGIIPISNWEDASASFYDHWSPGQTGKEIPDGKGASGRLIGSGSIAMDSTFIADITNNYKDTVYVQIDVIAEYKRDDKTFYLNLNIQTPYGRGPNICRVDDTMPNSEILPGNHLIDFCICDMSGKFMEIGRFKVRYRIVKIR